MADRYENGSGLLNPAVGIAEVTPNDSADLAEVTRAIMVGQAGDVSVIMLDGSSGVLPQLQPGQIYSFRVQRVRATNTTAAGIVAIY